ncbi:SpoIVB peptidase [Candidatus Formimonas warabiya]|uniref:SpoIVB peptidase n=1 Tax=Formimonas warabiya TaxID=1761012 RepID=A0A3G1KNM4_FORW1|nr:SpoIVB peptidase [Candidatus Formimonas warabiya]ATW24062.1 SpoIVB peptidase [Candidatus Formimonas warabiya]
MPPKGRLVQRLLLLVIVLSTSMTTAFYSYLLLPDEQKLLVGDSLNLPKLTTPKLVSGLTVYVESSKNGALQINGCPINEKIYKYTGETPVVTEPGHLNLKLKLFGIIPLKSMMVDVLPQIKVIPGGHSVGVMLQTEGVIVVGHSPVYGEKGQVFYPAREAGISLGDSLLQINGVKIKNEKHAAELIDQYGKKGPLEILIKQGGKKKTVHVTPRFCQDTQSFRIGLYIRDNAAGVGTITFYEPQARKFGALGHMIVDLDIVSGKNKGKIVKAEIQGIKPGKRGEPGEKIGLFIADELKGNIEVNSNFGIFGSLSTPLKNPYFKSSIPIALSSQIKEGPAEIITVILGDKLEKFDINILRVLPQHQPTGKGLVIQITDPRLLKTTGGIIQGMSGSPIIQDGRLVGAVTHVFVNDPTKGYGCLAEWMVLEAGLVHKEASIDRGFWRNLRFSYRICQNMIGKL